MSTSVGSPQLRSPAFVALTQVPAARELLLAGQAVGGGGLPVDGAALRIFDVELRTEAPKRFELLVRALLDGERAPNAATIKRLPMPVPVATDIQAIIRGLAVRDRGARVQTAMAVRPAVVRLSAGGGTEDAMAGALCQVGSDILDAPELNELFCVGRRTRSVRRDLAQN